MFIGYAGIGKAFKLLEKEIHGVVVSRDVVFDEHVERYSDMKRSSKFVSSDQPQIDLVVSLDLRSPELEDNMDVTRPVQSGHERPLQAEDDENGSEHRAAVWNEDSTAPVTEQSRTVQIVCYHLTDRREQESSWVLQEIVQNDLTNSSCSPSNELCLPVWVEASP